MTSYSSPNRMVWQFFDCLRRALDRAHDAPDHSTESQEAAVAVFLAVTTVETFINLYFRLLVEQTRYSQHKEQLLKDLSPPFLSLDKKIKTWPKRILGLPLDLQSRAGQEFSQLKSRRNVLMHFTSSHDAVDLPGVRIEGLPNTSTFDELTAADADKALASAEGLIAAILTIAGTPQSEIPRQLHLWIGKVPI